MYTALQRYESEQATSGLKFRYRVGRREHIENFNNIICIETTSRPHVLELITTTSIMQFPGTIKELAKAYPQFCKLSQSCLANLDNIKSVDFPLSTIQWNHFLDGKPRPLRKLLISFKGELMCRLSKNTTSPRWMKMTVGLLA